MEDRKLFEDAIRGMLAGLDPHSTYLDEQDYNDLQTSTSGEFSGLGIEVTMEDGYIKVISPIDDTPAYNAGVKAGDMIIRLNDTPVKGLTLREAVHKMRGKRGSAIYLMILRKSEKKPLKIKVVREQIQIKSVKSKVLEPGYGYIRLGHFQMLSASDMHKAVRSLKRKMGGTIAGLVIDMRNNPGGLLDSAIEVSDALLDSKMLAKDALIVYTEGRIAGSKFSAKATPGDIMNGAPIVVLVNGGSASGAEIVAGALQDHKRALIIGTKTFGKGSVQTVLPLDEKRGIKLTTALYYTPMGRSIQAEGIIPDIIVENVNVTKEDKSNWFSKKLSEADLKGHLANGSSKKKSAKDSPESEPENSQLIYQDYQLHQALNILKGLHHSKSLL